MSSKEINVVGMVIAAFLCLAATGLSLTDSVRFGPVSLFLFPAAWLVFFLSIKVGNTASGDET